MFGVTCSPLSSVLLVSTRFDYLRTNNSNDDDDENNDNNDDDRPQQQNNNYNNNVNSIS